MFNTIPLHYKVENVKEYLLTQNMRLCIDGTFPVQTGSFLLLLPFYYHYNFFNACFVKSKKRLNRLKDHKITKNFAQNPHVGFYRNHSAKSHAFAETNLQISTSYVKVKI